MGFFKGIFGGQAPQPTNPPAPPPQPLRGPGGGGGRRAQDDSAGSPITPLQTQQGPFPKSLRLRASREEYGLRGRWMVVTLSSPQDWQRAKDEVCHAYYKQFGLYTLPDGTQTIRWNEATWRAMLGEIQVLFDPSYAGGPAPSQG